MAPVERGVPGAVTDVIYKIASEGLWREAIEKGSFSGSPVDVIDGFIHFSTADQVRDTAARHFASTTGLVLIAIATAGLDLRWEPSRGGRLFPHLYDELPLSAVQWVKPLPIDAHGRHECPALD